MSPLKSGLAVAAPTDVCKESIALFTFQEDTEQPEHYREVESALGEEVESAEHFPPDVCSSLPPPPLLPGWKHRLAYSQRETERERQFCM